MAPLVRVFREPLEKNEPRVNPIDRTKHDEDLVERMIGGARLDRRSRPKPRERHEKADDKPHRGDGRSRER